MPPKKLLVVYNANSGKLNSLLGSAHKILSPKTYPCKLCDITHGIFNENEVWKQFRETSGIHFTFYHKDEFLKEYPTETKQQLPAFFNAENMGLLISSEELKNLKTAQELIMLLNKKISAR